MEVRQHSLVNQLRYGTYCIIYKHKNEIGFDDKVDRDQSPIDIVDLDQNFRCDAFCLILILIVTIAILSFDSHQLSSSHISPSIAIVGRCVILINGKPNVKIIFFINIKYYGDTGANTDYRVLILQ
jgi:hypothetical protein